MSVTNTPIRPADMSMSPIKCANRRRKNEFRLNSLILTAGDRLVARLRLTSARWQILGAMAAAERPQPVAWLARDMGANRQNVQRIINDLHREGLVAFAVNPHHRRAQLAALTDKTSKGFIVGFCVAGPIRYKLPFACFILGVAGRGAPDRGEHRQAARAFAQAVIRSVELIVQPDARGLIPRDVPWAREQPCKRQDAAAPH